MRTNRRPVGPLAASGMVSLWGGSSLISSIQSGQVNAGASSSVGTVTIAAVDTTRSILITPNQYRNFTYGNEVRVSLAHVVLTNSTTVTATTGGNPSGTDVATNYFVIEFMPGVLRSVQRGTITVGAAAASATATVNAVNTSRSMLICNQVLYSGTAALFNDVSGNGDIKHWSPFFYLTNATTVTLSRPGTANSVTASYDLVEFY